MTIYSDNPCANGFVDEIVVMMIIIIIMVLQGLDGCRHLRAAAAARVIQGLMPARCLDALRNTASELVSSALQR